MITAHREALLLDLALLKRIPDGDKPVHSPRRKELALRIQSLLFAHLVESAIKDVPRRVLRRRSPFRNRTLARRAGLTVQERTGPVVGRVLLRSAAREVEGGQGDLVRDSVGSVIVFCRAKQRARISCEDAAQDCSSRNGTAKSSRRSPSPPRSCTESRSSSSLRARPLQLDQRSFRRARARDLATHTAAHLLQT